MVLIPGFRHGKILAATLTFAVLIALLYWRDPSSVRQSINHRLGYTYNQDTSLLHFLIPATRSNVNLCKLLLSATILGYPTPVFINWGAHEAADEYKQHLAKVQTILNHLEAIVPQSPQDLVLIVDGYDVWFQLRADVLIKRYYAMNDAVDEMFNIQYGSELFAEHNMTQTVVFGPDKICWPIDYRRPACWTMPKGTLQDFAFGPETGLQLEEHNQPRWLNSGTILGPIEDVREVFRATLDAINRKYVTDSDQFYFSNVYGEQEYARMERVPGMIEEKMKERYEAEHSLDETDIPSRDRAVIEPGRKTEYHIGLDWRSDMFQTLAHYKQVLTWMHFRNAFKRTKAQKAQVVLDRYSLELPQDLAQSASPYQLLDNTTNHRSETWQDVELLVNTISRTVPVVIHCAGAAYKVIRRRWWARTWFYQEGKALRAAALAAPRAPISDEYIGGRYWWTAERNVLDEANNTLIGGGWSDAGPWLSWNELCGEHEIEIYPNATTSASASASASASVTATATAST